MPAQENSRVIEDYVTLIWKASEWPGDGLRVTTSDLASALQVTPSTVSANLKKLAREELINYEPYGDIGLTDAGERIALDVVRRHRLLETYLVEFLGFQWDEVHDEADRLEHAASDLLIERIDAMLGHPTVDPHGDPIPRPGIDVSVPARLLTSCRDTETVRVARVSDANPAILRFLSDRNITVGSDLEVITPMSTTGLMTIRHADTTIELSTVIATAIHVSDPH
ncbi:metal-dependent transcriptional regulator [Corynebacterium sputi]|uniref:metal-dependent transcriptional regulator n=1 Tax=Corynebacterium sputi TaxID=489915 RepID=UPI00055622C0|nr:metal-dependent transcriptional regulator [Corynebacterium sputi]